MLLEARIVRILPVKKVWILVHVSLS